MSYIIKPRRGLKKDLPVLNEHELAFTTDTKEIYVGSLSGNQLIGGWCKVSMRKKQRQLLKNYLEENPIETGATTEQAAQINTNKTDIANLETNKQDKLVSGTNIKPLVEKVFQVVDIPLPVIPTFKTIDGEPILGEGNFRSQ